MTLSDNESKYILYTIYCTISYTQTADVLRRPLFKRLQSTPSGPSEWGPELRMLQTFTPYKVKVLRPQLLDGMEHFLNK